MDPTARQPSPDRLIDNRRGSSRPTGRPTGKLARRGGLIAAVTLVAGLLLPTPGAHAYPPDPPAESEASALLDDLTVQHERPDNNYDRDLFPHWSSQSDGCDTRQVVLQRDGEDVAVDDDCHPTSGRWYSVYDATWVEDSADVHIDHVVALREAWRSGADTWSQQQREEFANDLTQWQLIAVSASSNTSKSDFDPADWRPDNEGVWCVYARGWIWVKSEYDLTVDAAEKSALESMLDRC